MKCKYLSDNGSEEYFNLFCYTTQKHYKFPTLYFEFNDKVTTVLNPEDYIYDCDYRSANDSYKC